jgi:hypothetical protein
MRKGGNAFKLPNDRLNESQDPWLSGQQVLPMRGLTQRRRHVELSENPAGAAAAGFHRAISSSPWIRLNRIEGGVGYFSLNQ